MAGSNKKSKKIDMLSWSDLPIDVVRLLLGRLYYIDQLRFRAVCKRWRTAGFVKYVDKLPWLMAYNWDAFYLYDASHKRAYPVSNSATREAKLVGTKVLHSKYGWILFKSKTQKGLLFFYTPFTDKIIELPKLPSYFTSKAKVRSTGSSSLDPSAVKWTAAAFSNAPDCPDCVILVLRCDSKKGCISTCKVGDKTWSEFWFDNYHGWFVHDVEYVDGVFYSVWGGHSAIGAFNVAKKDWKIIPYPKESEIFWTLPDHLIECDGELLMAHYNSDLQQWRVIRMDGSQVDWEDILLFLGNSSIAIPVEKGSELSRIIHWYNLSCYFDCPCLAAKQSAELPESHSSCPKLVDHDWTHLIPIWLHPPHPIS